MDITRKTCFKGIRHSFFIFKELAMKAKQKADRDPIQPIQSIGGHASDFNFEQWAKQVRPRLLASLQKRGMR
jgi:hypothetical protein